VARSRLQSPHLGDAWWWRVETLALHYRAVPPAALCIMCYVPRRGERGVDAMMLQVGYYSG
jgi:hypothetical protein